MKLEQTVSSALEHYPEIYGSREGVLVQLFCVNGNGYDWVDGELVDKFPEELPKKTTLKKQFKKGVKRSFRFHYNMFGKKPFKFVGTKKDSIDMRSETGQRLKWILSFIIGTPYYKQRKKCIKHQIEFTKKIHTHLEKDIYPMSEEYADLIDFPDNIRPDWLEAIKETAQYVIDIEKKSDKKKSIENVRIAKLALDKCKKIGTNMVQ